MDVIETVSDMQARSEALRSGGRIIGFVPTMGYLHEGHLSLVRASKSRCDVTVASIFVNPAQFGPNEDYAGYPRDLDRDLQMAREAGVDIVYHPDASQMYPPGFQTVVRVERLSQGLCGSSRPGHFQGVATVVLKLFNQVLPHKAFFGLKDYQQVAVIRRMARDLDLAVEIAPCPIHRESDGLAMSSRNVYLSPEGREAALCLSRSIELARRLVSEGMRGSRELIQEVRDVIGKEPLAREDYVEIRDADTLEPLDRVERKAVLLLAVWIEKARLIDNAFLLE